MGFWKKVAAGAAAGAGVGVFAGGVGIIPGALLGAIGGALFGAKDVKNAHQLRATYKKALHQRNMASAENAGSKGRPLKLKHKGHLRTAFGDLGKAVKKTAAAKMTAKVENITQRVNNKAANPVPGRT
jgi:hypothetical protein